MRDSIVYGDDDDDTSDRFSPYKLQLRHEKKVMESVSLLSHSCRRYSPNLISRLEGGAFATRLAAD